MDGEEWNGPVMDNGGNGMEEGKKLGWMDSGSWIRAK